MTTNRSTLHDSAGVMLALAATCRPTDLHVRGTRILRAPRDVAPTLVDAPRPACGTCAAPLADDVQYCCMCGVRVRTRWSLIGAQVDDYAIEEQLREGETSTLYRARHVESGQEVALDVLHAELALDPAIAARFRRDAKNLMRLRDPHTIAVFDHGQTPAGVVYVAMELVRGERLDVRVRVGGAMAWREALRILRAACSSVGEARVQGLAPSAITSANVVIAESGDIKLLLSPPQAASVTEAHAIGAIGLELLVGRRRHPGETSLPASVPVPVRALIERCFADRSLTAGQLADEIDVLLGAPTSQRRVFPHTPAFELEPAPAFFARGSAPELDAPPPVTAWKRWAAGLAAFGVGLGAVLAGCM